MRPCRFASPPRYRHEVPRTAQTREFTTMNVQTTIRADRQELLRQAREEAYSAPIADFHPGAPKLFQNDTLWPWFERPREGGPGHYCTRAPLQPHWSVHTYNANLHV